METQRGRPTVVKKEMGITHKDFYTELPTLLGTIPYQQIEDTVSFQLNGKSMEIVLGPEEVREIGRSVRLPVTFIEIRFFDCSEEEMGDFVELFNLRFMKGGG
jgi:hypothetical protein